MLAPRQAFPPRDSLRHARAGPHAQPGLPGALRLLAPDGNDLRGQLREPGPATACRPRCSRSPRTDTSFAATTVGRAPRIWRRAHGVQVAAIDANGLLLPPRPAPGAPILTPRPRAPGRFRLLRELPTTVPTCAGVGPEPADCSEHDSSTTKPRARLQRLGEPTASFLRGPDYTQGLIWLSAAGRRQRGGLVSRIPLIRRRPVSDQPGSCLKPDHRTASSSSRPATNGPTTVRPRTRPPAASTR